MIKLRERSHIFLWTLLFFFIASMTVGGLVGGANVLDFLLGRKNTNLYVGEVDGKGVTRRAYELERNIKLSPYNQSNIPITDQVVINAGNQAWNSLIERAIKDKKIDALKLNSYGDEIYNFLLLTPPIYFQEDLKENGLFTDEEGNFNIELYQEAARSGNIPEDVVPVLKLWENYIKTWLADRKLGNLYRTLGSINDNEIRYQYKKDSLKCDIDYLYVDINSIPDSLFNVSDNEISSEYNKTKDKYKLDPTRKIEYAMWTYPAISSLSDTVDNTSVYAVKDSLEEIAWLFADEARYSSFKEAADIYEIEKIDTTDISLDFSAQGIPRNMRPGRTMVRFAFDNSVGKISEPIAIKDGIIAVVHTISKNSNKYKSLDDVKGKIKRDLLKNKKIEYARETIFSNIDFNMSWDKISEDNNLINLIKNERNTISSRFKEIGSSSELIGTLMSLSPGEISKVIEMKEFNSKSFVVRLNGKDDIDEDNYLDSYESIKSNLLSQRNNRAFTDWLEYNKELTSSEDWRKDIY